MKKKLWAVIAIGLSVITLVGCSTNNSKSGASSSSTSKTYKVEKAFKNATTDVNSLFEIRYSKLRDGLKKDEIDEVSREVKALSSKKGHGLKPILKDHIGIAYKLYPKFANDQSSKSSIKAAKSSSRASEESSEDASLEAASSSIEAEESSKSAASSKTASIAKEKQPSDNTVYGALTNSEFKRNRLALYVSTGALNYVSITAANKKSIEMVHLDFADIPLMYSDTEMWTDYIRDWMEPDAVLASKISEAEMIYHSSKINKNYRVKLTLNGDGDITHIYIQQA